MSYAPALPPAAPAAASPAASGRDEAGAVPALRVLPAPSIEGPVLAAVPDGRGVAAAIDGQLALPLDWRLPNGLPAQPPAPRRLRLVTDSDAADAAEATAAAATATATGERPDLPPPAPWAGRLATAVLEVAAGERPPSQLLKWTTPAIYNDLARRFAVAARRGNGRPGRPQCRSVHSVHASQVRPGVVEVCAVVSGATRSRAVAIRLEALKGRWIATAVEIG